MASSTPPQPSSPRSPGWSVAASSAVPMFGRQEYKGEAWNAETYAVACNLLELANSWWNSYTEEDAYRAVIGNAPRDAGFRDADVLRAMELSTQEDRQQRDAPSPRRKEVGLFIPYATPHQPLDPAAFFTKGEGLDVLRLATRGRRVRRPRSRQHRQPLHLGATATAYGHQHRTKSCDRWPW